MPIITPSHPPPPSRSHASSPPSRRLPLSNSHLNSPRPETDGAGKSSSAGKSARVERERRVREQVLAVHALMDGENSRAQSREKENGNSMVEEEETIDLVERGRDETGEEEPEGGEESMVVSNSQPTGLLHLAGAANPFPPPPTSIDQPKPKPMANGFLPMEVVEIPDDDTEEDDEVPPTQEGTAVEEDEEEEMVSDVDSDEEDLRLQSAPRTPLHVEVRLRPQSTILYDPIRRAVAQYITGSLVRLETNAEVPGWRDYAFLTEHVSLIRCETDADEASVTVANCSLHLHIYQPPSTDSYHTFSASLDSDDLPPPPSPGNPPTTSQQGATDGGDDVAASVLELPAGRLEGVWESLVYEGGVKSKLLDYIYSTVRFSEHDVDHNLVSWHRLVLLHGPPGTGKTSLCRGLAQKLSIRLSSTYDQTRLVEINSHSLFSKWFSESDKLVQKLFQQVTDMVDDESCFVVVLIDEVESLTSARAGAMSGKEPSDALRVVNALLTQLDKLRQRKNVLVLTTSNLSAAIDPAFVDRADIKQYIGLPPTEAVYWILRSCVGALMDAGLVRTRTLLEYKAALAMRNGPPMEDPSTGSNATSGRRPKRKRVSLEADKARKSSVRLLELAERCQGMSGRTLRRLPLLTDAKCASARWSGEAIGVGVFFEAMSTVIDEQAAAMEKMEENSC